MSGFYIVNEKRFPLEIEQYKNTDLLPYYRWEHRVTIGYNGRRFFVFLDNLKQRVYIEEYDGNLSEIDDENLWKSLVNWATEGGFLIIAPPILKPQYKRFV